MIKKFTSTLSKTAIFCKSYIESCIWLLVFALGIRFFESILLTQINHNFFSSIMWNLTGLCFDIGLFLRVSVWMILPFIAFCFVNERITKVALRILLSLMLLLSMVCVLFFINSGFLLDKVVFSYSLKENIHIIQTSSKSPVWVYFVVVALPVLFYYFSSKRIKINNILLTVFVVLITTSFFVLRELPLTSNQYHVKKNKTHFFLKSSLSMFYNNDANLNDGNYPQIVNEFRGFFPEFTFLGNEYPFLYKTETKDVLSPFFNLKPEPPNLVFIIVEGLGYEFFKNDYQLMPFLDSLSTKSLNWENCFSVAARTYGVLPGLFGASPLGEEGFLFQCPNNPEHHTLLKILHQNNYSNRFFYGGSINFDNMKHFCNQNNMTYLKEEDWEQDIKDASIKIPWGFEDHLVYLQGIRKLNNINKKPRVDVYLSYFTHNPFKYPNQQHYQNLVKNKITQNKTLSEKEKKEMLNSIHIYASYPYADWALQQLFEGYKKRDDYENTIFIITGDHHVTAKQFGGYYNYHVPLIIYSPMLNTSRSMKGVVTHRDITPTFLSLLQNKFYADTPKEVTWLSSGLDTSIVFNAHTFSPLQLIDHSIGGVLYKNYLLCEDILGKFEDGVLQKNNNPELLSQMNRLLTLYRYLDSYVFNHDALIRNQKAYKYESANTFFNVEDAIAEESYYAKNSKLSVVKGPEKHKTTLYFGNSDLYPIDFIKFDIPDDIEELRVDIEFNIYVKNEGIESFYLVLDLSELSYRWVVIDDDRQNKWYTCKHTVTYKKELWEHSGIKPLLKVYLWNPNELEGYVDDIKVTMKSL